MAVSSEYRYKNFSGTYLRLKLLNPSLTDLAATELGLIQAQFEKDNTDIKTRQHIVLTMFILCAFSSLMIAMQGIEHLSAGWTSGIIDLKKKFIHYREWQLTYVLMGLIIVPILYLLILPAVSGFRKNGITYIQPINPILKALDWFSYFSFMFPYSLWQH